MFFVKIFLLQAPKKNRRANVTLELHLSIDGGQLGRTVVVLPPICRHHHILQPVAEESLIRRCRRTTTSSLLLLLIIRLNFHHRRHLLRLHRWGGHIRATATDHRNRALLLLLLSLRLSGQEEMMLLLMFPEVFFCVKPLLFFKLFWHRVLSASSRNRIIIIKIGVSCPKTQVPKVVPEFW